VESIDISHFLGDAGAPRLVACLSLRYQIATKLHARPSVSTTVPRMVGLAT
jgi:hypothetical protein